jgi:hypothetical protein
MRRLALLPALALLAACGETATEPPVGSEPAQAELAETALAPALSLSEQSIVDAMRAGGNAGAVINREVGCGIFSGFNNNGEFVGFGGLFPTPGPRGICPLSNFERANPDGTIDLHLQGSGAFFLVLFNPPAEFPSEGSSVRWRMIAHENGTRVFTVSGTLSDGSRVRAHFVTDRKGDNKAANTLWVEGLGYVVGGPPGR